MLDSSGTVVNALGIRLKPYLTQIVSTILWCLNTKSAKVCQQAADLTTHLAVIIKQCGKDQLQQARPCLIRTEEYPDTLGSIIAAVGAIANVVGMMQMNPPVKDLHEFSFAIISTTVSNYRFLICLVPRMTPILCNRHKKVQEVSINLIGHIA